jgi:hypothetical protein
MNSSRNKGGMFRYIVLPVLAIAGFGYFHGFYTPTATERADMPAGMPELLQPPVQISLTPPRSILMNGYTVTEVASYEVTARILSTDRYFFDRQSKLSPVDLALGWGPMADNRILRKLDISQSWRFYHWEAAEYPIPPEQISTNSANTHIIPANDKISSIVTSLHRGQVVTLKGYLVNIQHADGWHWQTSLSRTDTGDGACEVMLVESVQVR